jgi:hypothetical protein
VVRKDSILQCHIDHTADQHQGKPWRRPDMRTDMASLHWHRQENILGRAEHKLVHGTNCVREEREKGRRGEYGDVRNRDKDTDRGKEKIECTYALHTREPGKLT